MSKVRKIFSDSLIYSIGNIVNRFLSFLLLPLYTHYFFPDEFGIFSIIYSFWFFAAVVYLYGMETAVQKFFLEDKNERKKIFSSSLNFIFFTSLFFSIIIFSASDYFSYWLTNSTENSYLIKLLSVVIVIDVLSRFPMIVLNSLQQSKVYTVINIITVALNILSNLFFIILLRTGIEGIFYSFLISYTFQFAVSMVYVLNYYDLKIDIGLIRKLLSYSHFFIYYGLFIISIDLIDRVLLGWLKGNEAAGIYSANYRLAMIMNLLISGFRTAWFPFFMDLKENTDNKKVFSEVFTYFNYIGMALFILIALFAEDIIKLNIYGFYLLDPAYWSGINILPLILLSYFFFGLYTNLIVASFYKDKVSLLLISSGVAACINIALNIFLIPILSLYGAAISTLISYAVMFAIIYYLSQKAFFIFYPWKKILIIWLISVIFVVFHFVLKANEVSYFYLITYKILTIFVFLLILYLTGFYKIIFRSK